MEQQNTNVVWHHATVTRSRREQLNQHKSVILWFTGLSGRVNQHWRMLLKKRYTKQVVELLSWMVIMSGMDCAAIWDFPMQTGKKTFVVLRR
jgi:hypothetical protein